MAPGTDGRRPRTVSAAAPGTEEAIGPGIADRQAVSDRQSLERAVERVGELTGQVTAGERPLHTLSLPPEIELASRTALTSIIGYAEMLLSADDGRTPQRLRMLQAIEENGHRLFSLLTRGSADGRADLEAIESARAAEQVDIARILLNERDGLLATLTDFDAQVTVEVAPGLRASREQVTGLRLVTHNLMENAIKYSFPRGPVIVYVGSTDRLLSLEVIDSGMGIPLDEHEKVFERFYRSPYVKERRIPGRGVGLTTARNVVLRQGGAIELRSVPLVGTTVTVTLPLDLPELEFPDDA